MPRTFLLLLLFCIVQPALGQRSYELNTGWKCKQASAVGTMNGDSVSMPGFNTVNWLPATVPGTVLTTLLANKLIPDPFYGMNNEKIEDIYTAGVGKYTYWFVNDFTEKIAKDEQVWLELRGVNYGCHTYINGHQVDVRTEEGMFCSHTFNISRYLSPTGHNRLAIIVYPPDPPGNPNGGQGGDGTIANSVCNQFVAGWDWIQPIHDRNTGIWDKVFIRKTKSVQLKHSHIVTNVPGIRKATGPQAPTTLQVTTELLNTTNRTITGFAQYSIAGKKVRVPVSIPQSDEPTLVTFPVQTIQNPKLWWPNGYGQQNLYTIKVQFFIGDTALSDEEPVTFGIRELQPVWNTTTKSREMRVNGQRIFLKGGNWILSDAMLRLSPERYNAEIRMHRQMNLNLLRVWGGGITERPEFYDACDKYGLLVMQDLWLSGDCNGRWYDPLKKDDTTTRRQYPHSHQLFLSSVEDQVKLLRNHPSLALWCGGNEIRPPVDILEPLERKMLPTLDGTRFFFEYSNDDSMSLNSHDGPYTVQTNKYFWQNRSYPFNSEIGSVGIGELESLERFLPKENLVPPYYDTGKKTWVVDSAWKYHKFYGYDSSVELYGHPADVKDFTRKAQLVNYEQYRSLMESFVAHMWDWYTGVIIWKTQNPWTAMVGQMYDVYLDPNACLYGLQEAAKPLHAIYNPAAKTIYVDDHGLTATAQLQLTIKEISIRGKEKILLTRNITVQPSSCDSICTLAEKPSAGENAFLLLELKDRTTGKTADENLYWLPDGTGNYTGLQKMKKANMIVTARVGKNGTLLVTLKNPAGNPISFFNRLNVYDAITHQQLLPVFYSDNYVSVLPGQSKTITIEVHAPMVGSPLISVKGWNLEGVVVEVKK